MELVSLQDLIKGVAAQFNDVYRGVTTSPSAAPNQFIDGMLANVGGITGLDNQYVGSQVIFEEPAATNGGLTTPGPHNIIANASTSGTFTASPQFRSSGVVGSGLYFFIIRTSGRGRPYNTYLEAIRWALDELDVSSDVVDSSLTTADAVYEYTIPGTLGGIYKVELVKAGYTTLQLLPRDWKMKPGRTLWISNANVYVAFGYTLKLYGIAESALPTTLNGTVYGPRNNIVDLATEYLQRNSSSAANNQRGSLRQQERLRFQRMAPRPNLRRVIP